MQQESAPVFSQHRLDKTARRWGQLPAKLGHDGADLLIAATALTHGLTVVTRKVKHFLLAGVAVFNPFDNETISCLKNNRSQLFW